jgi:hypothetical protein
MSDVGDRWHRQDALRRHDEHRQRTMKATRRGDTTWALEEIVGPDAAIDYLRAVDGTGSTTPQPQHADVSIGESRWPHTFVTTIDELLANVAATPAGVALRASRVDNDADVVVEAGTDWVAGPPVVAGVLGLDSPPSVGHFYVRAAVIADIVASRETLRQAAELAADIGRLVAGE